jgi:hypothetical protein
MVAKALFKMDEASEMKEQLDNGTHEWLVVYSKGWFVSLFAQESR